MPRIVIEKSNSACLSAFLKEGRLIKNLPFINSCIIEIDEKKLRRLKNLSCNVKISKETGVTAQLERAKQTVKGENCGDLSGKNITAAVLDTGIAPLPCFSGRIKAFKDVIGGKTAPYDDNSHGSHVSGILGANGKIKGIAPDISIVSVKVLDKFGRGSSADLLEGLSWVYDNRKKYNIQIVNLSVGAGTSDSFDPLVTAVEALWDEGIAITTAAGNGGPAPSSVTSPGTSRKVITVGCLDDDKHLSIWGSSVKDFSGRGPTKDCIIKPDILAPGAEIISCSNIGDPLSLSGTSMSTPIVTGAIALLLEKHPNLTPNQIKYLLKITADDIKYPKNRQGWGLLNIEKLLNTNPVLI